MNRRAFLESTAALAAIRATGKAEGRARSQEPLAFRLRETGGIRRYGYPVTARLPVDLPDEALRLTREGRDVAAQFRRVESPGGVSTILDFNTSPGPFEVETYVIARRGEEKPRPPTGRGMRAEVGRGTIEVSNPPHISYTLGEDLAGFLRSVRIPGIEFLEPRSGGFFVSTGGARQYFRAKSTPGGDPPRAVVSRQGPLAVCVHFQHAVSLESGHALPWNLSMTFPSSKSWVEVDWSIDDPDDRIASMGVDMALALEGKPTLVDCGARSTVYSTLERGDRLTFEAGGDLTAQGRELAWRITSGHGQRSALEAAGMRGEGAVPEGWVHVMDSRRCTAMAVGDFAHAAAGRIDRFEIGGDGLLRFERQFRKEGAPPAPERTTSKKLRFWTHFVPMPVQVGAKTSPQAMLAPLVVEWE